LRNFNNFYYIGTKTTSLTSNSFGRPFVKRFTLCYRTIVLSVTLVYCGQTFGWSKMKLGKEVSLSPSDTVLDGDPALPKKGHSTPPNFSTDV